jgi:hypothetical protein
MFTIINPLFNESDRRNKNEPPQCLISSFPRYTATEISESDKKEGNSKYISAQTIKAIACKKHKNGVKNWEVNAKPKEIVST